MSLILPPRLVMPHAALHVPAPAAGSALRTNLISWWELDEASGQRNDSHTNGYHLTDNNTVTTGTGIGGSGTAAQFLIANSESLSRASNADLAYSGNFTFASWVYNGANSGIAGKDGGFGNFEWRLWSTAETCVFTVFHNEASSTQDAVVTGLTANTWHLIVATFTASGGGMTIARNGGTRVTATFGSTMTAGTGTFRLGAQTSTSFMTGRLSKAAFWKRVLTEAEEDELYNGGAGITYAATA